MSFVSNHPRVKAFLSWIETEHPGVTQIIDDHMTKYEAKNGTVSPFSLLQLIPLLLSLLNIFVPNNAFLQQLIDLLNKLFPLT